MNGNYNLNPIRIGLLGLNSNNKNSTGESSMKLNREQAIEIAGVTKGKQKMKTTRTLLSSLGLFALAIGLTFGASSAHAAIITQTVGNLDWNDAIWGSPAAAPTSGNDYVTATGVASDVVRLSADGSSSTFGGDSLKVVSGIRALVKNLNSTSTINGSLTLDGGAQLDHAPDIQNRSVTLDVTQLIVNGIGNKIGANTFTSGFTIADQPEGPSQKVAENPVVDGGHEVCVWPTSKGVASLHCNVGPQGDSMQFAADGLHFSKVMDIVPPKAPGLLRADHFENNADMELNWGVCMREENCWPWLQRFDLDSEPSREV